LGLKSKENTTYTPIRAKWLLNTPTQFKIWFIQGLADSDGYIDVNTFRGGVITEPNTSLIESLFKTLKVHTLTGSLHRGTLGIVTLNLKDANSLPLFNPYVKSYRYDSMQKLAMAKTVNKRLPKQLCDCINKLKLKGLSKSEIIRTILNEQNVRVSIKGINNQLRKGI
jgi:hypothetical protein